MDQWGTFVTGLLGFALFAAVLVALVVRRWRVAGYLAIAGYIMFWPIHLWFWQFELIRRAPLPHWYFWSAVQGVLLGIVPLVWFCFRRFRPVMTALFLAFALSQLLQFFSYMYWSYGTTNNFSIRLSHLDSFYFALGTLTTAGTGNVSATSEITRGLQTLQMGFDLVLFGFVVTLILARYSTLLNRSQMPSGDIAVAKPTPAPDGSGQSLPVGEPTDRRSNQSASVSPSDAHGGQMHDECPCEAPTPHAAQRDGDDHGQDDRQPLK
jgi:hypothetical protein